MKIWRIHMAWWILKVYKHTLSEYVILIAFPLQKWLHERASMLRYTYIARRVRTKVVLVEIRGSYSGVAEGLPPPSLDDYFQTFWRFVVHSSSGSNSPRRLSLDCLTHLLYYFALRMKATRLLETSRNTRPTTWNYIPQDSILLKQCRFESV
jgi:hypothetical protein